MVLFTCFFQTPKESSAQFFTWPSEGGMSDPPCHVIPCGTPRTLRSRSVRIIFLGYDRFSPFFWVWNSRGKKVDPATEDGGSVGVWSLEVPRFWRFRWVIFWGENQDPVVMLSIIRFSHYEAESIFTCSWNGKKKSISHCLPGNKQIPPIERETFFYQPLWEGTCYLPERQVFNSWHVQLMFRNFTMTMAQKTTYNTAFLFSLESKNSVYSKTNITN